jgi:predicted nucleotidyltransferase
MRKEYSHMLDEIVMKRDRIEHLCRKHHVLRLAVFGSALRDDFNPSRSDIDFVVEFGPLSLGKYADNYFAFHHALTALLGRKVDVISSRNIRNPFFRHELETTQETLYAA